jgi:hypothetical protein
MTLRYVSAVFTGIVLICTMPIVAPAYAQTRDASLLPPEQSGVITVAGCLQLGGKDGDRFVLANPKRGPIANVPEDTCKATVDDRALDLQDTEDHGINRSMLGRWVEVNGRLEKETDADLTNLRELEVRSFRMVPVLPPPVIVEKAVPAPEPRQQSEQLPVTPPAEPPIEQPIGTTGVSEPAPPLPQTAGSLPMIGLLGLLSLAGGLGFRFYRSHERG